MKSNIKKLYLANFLTGLTFWYAVEKLFMQSIGIGPFLIGVNAVVLLVIIVVFDVPSGVLADKWKRKYTLIMALTALSLSSLVLGLSRNFAVYVFGTVLFGGYIVLTSGTYQAMMYDSLAEIGEEKHYDKHQGRSYGLFLAGVSIGSLAGGYIAQNIGLRQTFYYSVVTSVLTVFLLLTTSEPKFHKETSDNKLRAHVKASVKVILSQSMVLQLSLLLVVAGMLRSTQNEFSGLYYIQLGMSAVVMGYVNAGKWIAGAIGQFVAPLFGKERSIRLVPWFFLSFLIFSLITTVNGVMFFLIASFLFSVITNQTEATVQSKIPSHLRATTLSLTSFITNVVMIPLSLLFGWLTQHYTVFRGYQVFATIGIGYLLYWVVRGKQRSREL
jgi:MFS family permease